MKRRTPRPLLCMVLIAAGCLAPAGCTPDGAALGADLATFASDLGRQLLAFWLL